MVSCVTWDQKQRLITFPEWEMSESIRRTWELSQCWRAFALPPNIPVFSQAGAKRADGCDSENRDGEIQVAGPSFEMSHESPAIGWRLWVIACPFSRPKFDGYQRRRGSRCANLETNIKKMKPPLDGDNRSSARYLGPRLVCFMFRWRPFFFFFSGCKLYWREMLRAPI